MQSLTYKDIIDEKITEWQNNLKKLEQQSAKASPDAQTNSSTKIKDLKSAINSAIVQLHTLDAQETVDNTMDTKDKIIKIFGSIDKEFTGFESKAPFML